ncbi:MAG: hypothetical protein J6Y20_04795 [Lachnospiraceae bacterium]|nr:hypothetical protein [Kiritimatiellia bacterium]MBP5461424.1 hypothetical protein [Lachnospiraceae bacterium]
MATKKNAAAPVVENNAAAKNNTNTNKNAAAENAAPVKLSPVEILEISVGMIKEYGTISAIRDKYAENVNKYGKDNFAAILKQCQTTRAAEIAAAAEKLNNNVFTFNGISAAVFAAVAKDAGYIQLCKFARKEYAGTDAERAAAVVRDFFAAVDETGAPLCKVNYINAAGTEIYTAYARKKLSFSNAVTILKSALDGMKSAATNAATRKNGNDNAAATRANVRAVGVTCAVYAAAVDETGRVSLGERRDNSKDERTRKNAAAALDKPLFVGVVPVATWNAAVNGNEDAAAAVDAARDAAKDAAAAAGHAAAVEE